jgi:hypothetical protein
MDSVHDGFYLHLEVGLEESQCRALNGERKRTLSSYHASSGGTESSLTIPLPGPGDLQVSNRGGQFVLELEGSEDDAALRSKSFATNDIPLRASSSQQATCAVEWRDGGVCEGSGGTENF